MPKPMSRRNLERALRHNGCTITREGGRHTVYRCPCGEHQAPVPRHNEISAGVVGAIIRQMPCLPKGWLQ